MSFTQPENGAAGKTSGRTRRVISDRLAHRRDNLIKELMEPSCVVEDVDTLTAQARGIRDAFKPRNAWQDWVTGTVATFMLRLNRCERIERKLRDLASYRAIEFWEEDQVIEVETLALKIDKNPDRVVAKLRQTPAGCDWLLKRWRCLAEVNPQSWTEAQRTLAGQMAGGAASPVDPMIPGFAAAQVANLESQRGAIEKADAIVRGLVEADLSDDMVPGLAKLRRYSRSLMRQMKWYMDQFHIDHADRWDDPMRQPGHISRGLLTEEHCRRVQWSFAEPKPNSDETKPISPDLPPQTDETKPFVRVELMANLADALAQVVTEKGFVTQTHNHDQSAHSRREARLNPADEAARRQKAARRRESLACGAGV